MTVLLLCHAAVTCFMTGLIWFVQVVHYPLLASVGRDDFVRYEQTHCRLTTLVVAPAMFVELCTSAWLALDIPSGIPGWMTGIGFVLVVLLWGITAAIQVPLHRRLSHIHDIRSIQALVRGNWFRTILWTVRSVLAFLMLAATSAAANP